MVDRSALMPGGPWYGLRELDREHLAAIIRNQSSFRPRQEVEDRPEYQQIIPYVVFHCGDRYLLTKRLRRSRESRLRRLYSLGVGGHINPDDGGAGDLIEGGLLREWAEEVDYRGALSFHFLGLLKDESSPVSRAHVGLIYLAEGQTSSISIRETDKLQGELLTLDEMTIFYLDMESWSQIIYDRLREGVVVD